MSRPAKHRAPRRGGWKRRTSIAVMAAGLSTLGAGTAGIVTAHAAASPGSAFGNVSIAATAAGMRVPGYSHAGEDAEAEVPFASSTLQTGGIGHATTSIFWPGGTGAHGGDTLQLLAGSCLPGNPTNSVPLPLPPVPVPNLPCVTRVPTLPDNVYKAMNDSYKAESQSGTGNPSASRTGPGIAMKTYATSSTVTAASSMAGTKLPGVGDTFGSTSTETSIRVTGPRTAVVDAASTVRNVSLGGGALTIAGITSIAHAVTNGVTASGSGSTTVTGMKIAGVPVTVDNTGIHVDGKGSSLPSLSSLNKALASSGFKVFVADPVKSIKGASAQVFAGQLVIMMTNAQYMSGANDTGQIVAFGGATINADANKGYVYHPGPFPTVSPPPVGSAPAPPPAATGTTQGGGPLPSSPQVAPQPTNGQPPLLAAQQSTLPGGIAPVWVVLTLLGSGLIAAGLRRLPDEVLAPRGAACALGEQS